MTSSFFPCWRKRGSLCGRSTSSSSWPTARDVTELRGLAKSQVSQAVEVLTDRGLLARRADGEDRRIIHLEITGEGAPLAREAQAVQAACGRRLLAGLAEEEQAVFLGLLERVLREMEELGAEKERWT